MIVAEIKHKSKTAGKGRKRGKKDQMKGVSNVGFGIYRRTCQSILSRIYVVNSCDLRAI